MDNIGGQSRLMKISYRMTSGAALGALVVRIASKFALWHPGGVLTAKGDSVVWDPCEAWAVHHTPLAEVAFLLCLAGFVVFTIQGLRNRPGPRWLAIPCVPALALVILGESRRLAREVRSGCSSKAGLIWFFIWLSVVMIMFLHHAVQPRILRTVKDEVREP